MDRYPGQQSRIMDFGNKKVKIRFVVYLTVMNRERTICLATGILENLSKSNGALSV